MNQQTSNRASGNPIGEGGGMSKKSFWTFFIPILLLAGVAMWASQKEYDYDQRKIQSIVDAASTKNLDALVAEIKSSGAEIKNAALVAQEQKSISEDDAVFITKIAMDPSLLKNGDNLAKALNIFLALKDGQLKELLRSALCGAWNNQFDFCNGGAAEKAEKQVAPKKEETAENEDVGALAGHVKAVQKANNEITKLKEKFAAKKINADQFKKEFLKKNKKLREVMSYFQRYIKAMYGAKAVADGFNLYENGGTNFHSNWLGVFRRWLATQKNTVRLNKALDDYETLYNNWKSVYDLTH